MTGIKSFFLTAAAAPVFATLAGHALANDGNAAKTTARTATAAATKDALVTLEKSAYEAWKSRDAKFWDTFLSARFVGYGSSGRLDKASATREYTGADCEIKSFALADDRMVPLGSGAALLTYESTVDGICGGQKVPAKSRAASIYVRDGGAWRGAFHAGAPIVDPKSASAKAADEKETQRKGEARPAAQDAGTLALMVAERAVWEAWREHDARKLEELTAGEISFVNIFGAYFATKADALKDWTGPGCDVKSVSVSDGAATMLSPIVGILTFRGAADGTCYGQKVGPIWGTSVYVKDGGAWRWTFGINLPAGR
jgi:hypothetical protein